MSDLRLERAVVLPSGWCTYCENDAKSIHLGYGGRCPVCGQDFSEEKVLQAQVEQLELDLDEMQAEHNKALKDVNEIVVTQQERIEDLEAKVIALEDASASGK